MYASRLTNTDPPNPPLPTLPPRLYSFYDPSEPQPQPHNHSSAATNFANDYQLMQQLTGGAVLNLGFLAMLNGADKNQIEDALQDVTLDKNIKLRMAKFLDVLQEVSSGSFQPSKTSTQIHAKPNMQSDQIHHKNLAQQAQNPHARVSNYSSQREPEERASTPPHNKFTASSKDNIIDRSTHKNSRFNHSKEGTDSKASHSKVFHKISIKSANKTIHANQSGSSNHKKEPTNRVSQVSKSRVQESSIGKGKQEKQKPVVAADKQRYQISKREREKAQTKQPTTNKSKSPATKIATPKYQSARTSFINSNPNPDELKKSRAIIKSPTSQGFGHSRVRSNLEGGIQSRVKTVEEREEKSVGKKVEETSMIKETMEKSLAFLDMLKMLEE